MFERCEQIRTQASLLFAHSIQIPTFQEQRKKSLSKIFGFLGASPLSPHEPVNGSPISAAKFFQRRLCCRARTLRRQYHTPVSSCKRDAPVLRAWSNPIP